MADATDAELVEKYSGHPVTRDSRPYYRGLLEQKVLLNKCGDCEKFHNPPRPMCPWCWSRNLTPTEIAGTGHIHLLLLLHQGPPAEGVDYTAGPYPVITVELDEQENLRLTGTAVGVHAADLEIGQQMELTWIERNGVPMPAFKPRDAA